MRKILSIVLVIAMLMTVSPVDYYASAETLNQAVTEKNMVLDQQEASAALFSTEDDIYEIMRGSRVVELDYKNPNRTYFDFPTSGRLVLSDDGRAKWTFDESGEYYAQSASKISGKQVSAGQHYLELVDNWGPTYETATINYTFYPNCTVYYFNGKKIEKLFSYELSESHIKKEIPAITMKGYSFDGWYTDQDLELPLTEVDTAVGNDWYLYPKCTALDYAITYELDGGLNAAINPAIYTIEDHNITLMPATKKGYSFVRWYVLSGGKKKDVTAIDATQCKNIKVYAEWSENKYQITYIDAYTHRNPSTYHITDETIKLKDPVRAGYEFRGWYTDAGYTESVDVIDCEKTEDITLYAKWEPITYSIHYELNGGVNAPENRTEYTVENIETIGTPTKVDYDFAGWYLDETFENPITEIANVDGKDVTLYAKWNEKKTEESVADTTPTPSVATPMPTDITPTPSVATPMPTDITPTPSVATPMPTDITPTPSIATPTPTESLYSLYKEYTTTIRLNYRDFQYAEVVMPSDGYIIISQEETMISIGIDTADESQAKRIYGEDTYEVNLKKGTHKIYLFDGAGVQFFENEYAKIHISIYIKQSSNDNKDEVRQSGDYRYYTIDSQSCGINLYIGKAKKIIVPNEIEGYKVRVIGERAFARKNIEQIVISKSVQEISCRAFLECKNLSSISFESGSKLQSIEEKAFSKCKKLKKIKIPKNVKKIWEGAFRSCESLSSVSFESGSKLQSIEEEAFSKCKKLKKIILTSKKIKWIRENSISGINKKAIIKVPRNKLGKYKTLFKKEVGFRSSMKIIPKS